MTAPNTTPGPWRTSDIHANGLYGNNGEAMVIAADRRICEVDCASTFKRGQGYLAKCAERDANAHLIAAAPDMYVAADDLLASLLAGGLGSVRQIERLQAALRKARGEA